MFNITLLIKDSP